MYQMACKRRRGFLIARWKNDLYILFTTSTYSSKSLFSKKHFIDQIWCCCLFLFVLADR